MHRVCAAQVTLRGPRKDAVVRQFLDGVGWGALDFLLMDTPPGTSDEHMSLVRLLSKELAPSTDGAIVVSTPQVASPSANPYIIHVYICTLSALPMPQAVSLVDVRKELSFCESSKLHVLGVVENMAPSTVETIHRRTRCVHTCTYASTYLRPS